MSLEQLLFFLLVIAIPLLERLITAVRGRRDTSRPASPHPAGAERTSPGTPAASADRRDEAYAGSNAAPPVSAPLPEAAARYAGSEAAAQPIPGGVLVPARRTGQDSPARTVRAVQASQATRHRATRQMAFSRADVRIAFMHMAILGPCRALEPRDSSRRA
jgi:hypothetical protein